MIIDVGLEGEYLMIDHNRVAREATVIVNGIDETATQAAASIAPEVLDRACIHAFSYFPALFEDASVVEL